MDGRVRSIAAGLLMVTGALLIVLASMRPWVSLNGPGLLPVSVDLGFDDLLIKPPLGFWNAQPYLIAAALALAAGGVALTVARLRGVGRRWRWPVAALAVPVVGLATLIWVYVKGSEAAFRPIVNQAAQFVPDFLGLDKIDVQAGSGLWLLTVGAVTAGVGALLPVPRSLASRVLPPTPRPATGDYASRVPTGPNRTPPPGPTAHGALTVPRARADFPPGWYPDQRNPQILRWFDGRVWTDVIRPR